MPIHAVGEVIMLKRFWAFTFAVINACAQVGEALEVSPETLHTDEIAVDNAIMDMVRDEARYVQCGTVSGMMIDYIPCERGYICSAKSLKCELPVASCVNGWCYIPAGSFLAAGSRKANASTIGAPAEPGVAIRISRDYMVNEHDVTRGEWGDNLAFAGYSSVVDWSYANCGNDCPATNITFSGHLLYANIISRISGYEECYRLEGCNYDLSGAEDIDWEGLLCLQMEFNGPNCNGYRLPTAFEVEFAMRAGEDYCPISEAISDICVYEEVDNNRCRYCGNCGVKYFGCKLHEVKIGNNEISACCGITTVGGNVRNGFGVDAMIGNVKISTGTLYIDNIDAGGVELIDPGYDRYLYGWMAAYGISIPPTPTGCCNYASNRLHIETPDTAGTTGIRLVRTVIN